jgi:ABC-type polysaccharide/polyol phosphate export permease
MIKIFRDLIKYRELLYIIVWRDINIKYKQSVMGFMWAILMPMIIIITGVIVRFAMARLSNSPLEIKQIITVSVKAVPWAFFISSISFATNSLISNANLVTKIYFPREIFPLSAVLSQLFDLMVASGAMIVFLSALRVGWSIHLVWVFPLLLILILFAMALGLLLSAANLFFRDVKYLVSVITNFAIFFTPVFYDARLAGKWESLLLLNPVAPILEGLNSCIVLHQPPQGYWIMYSAVVSVLGAYLAMRFFKKLEPKFAENI